MLVANWKMFLKKTETINLAREIVHKVHSAKDLEIVLAPSFLYLAELRDLAKKYDLALCGQDLSTEKEGAVTGQISGEMLKECGCQYVLVGHSERRSLARETEEMINRKINMAYSAGLIPLLCVGETMAEKQAEQTEQVLIKQIQTAIQKVSALPENELVIAYEPVWAIGSGNYLEVSEIDSMIKIIKRIVSHIYSEKFFEEKVRILYGGSVNNLLAPGYFAEKRLSGLLVGRASCHAEDFASIASFHNAN